MAGSLITIPRATKVAKFTGKFVMKVVGEVPEAIKKFQQAYLKKYPAFLEKLTSHLLKQFRDEFKNTKASKLLSKYADTKESIQNLPESIRKILRTGKLPEGYVLHHKTPLFRHGSNNKI